MNSADLILKGNAVFTACGDQPEKKIVAIKNNKILAVDEWENCNDYQGEETKLIDCGEQLIMPGFHDSHFHLSHGINQTHGVDLSQAVSEEDAVMKVVEFAKSLPEDDSPIYGFYWYHMNWKVKELPTKKSLDRYFPDRPVILYRVESHGVWLNSKALEVLHIDRNTPNPANGNGEIVKDYDEEPSGYLHELAIFLMGEHSIKPIEKERAEYLDFFHQLSRLGITSISDLQYDMPTRYEILSELEKDDKLNIRYGFATLLNGDLTRAREYRQIYHSEKVNYLGLKQYVDGTILGYTGQLLEPYADKPETTNEMPFDFQEIERNVIAADKEGFRVRLHAIGDGAARIALDAFQQCRKENGVRDARHSIAHLEVIDAADVKRLSELEVIADIHPAHVTLPCENAENNPYPIHLGARADNCFLYKTMMKNGARLAAGSDYPVVTANPMLGVYRAVTRKFNDGRPDAGWLPEERLSMAEILRAYTLGTAYHDFKETTSGTLEPGKFADIIVLNKNLFNLKRPEEILQTKPILTIFDGRIVYNEREEKNED